MEPKASTQACGGLWPEGGVACGISEKEDPTRGPEVVLVAELIKSLWLNLPNSLPEGLAFLLLAISYLENCSLGV